MRQLKHHEKKLLKKVDFLNVRAQSLLQALLLLTDRSGSRMRRNVRSR
jgi:hypothetical protein